MKTLIIFFFYFVCKNCVSNQNGKVLKETLAGSRFFKNNTEMCTLLRSDPPPSFTSSSKFSPILCHLLHTRVYYEWLCKLRHHIQVGRLPDQGSWLGLLTQSITRGTMWHAGQTSNNSRINIRWWRCTLPNGSSLALPHLTRNSLCVIG